MQKLPIISMQYVQTTSLMSVQTLSCPDNVSAHGSKVISHIDVSLPMQITFDTARHCAM